jgi:hypothetical protein
MPSYPSFLAAAQNSTRFPLNPQLVAMMIKLEAGNLTAGVANASNSAKSNDPAIKDPVFRKFLLLFMV